MIASRLVHPDPVLDRRTVVQRLLDRLGGKVYLEIGVELGLSLLPIRAQTKLAVDPMPIIPVSDRLRIFWHNAVSGQTIRLYQQTSDAFFATQRAMIQSQPIDVALVDGLHTDSQAYADVMHCLEVLRTGGVIVLHDCNPPSARIALPASSHSEALRQFPPDGDMRWCGDVWKAIVRLRSLHPELRVMVIDADFGIGLVTREPADRPLTLTPAEIDRMTYVDLEARRTELLNLCPASSFDAFVERLVP